MVEEEIIGTMNTYELLEYIANNIIKPVIESIVGSNTVAVFYGPVEGVHDGIRVVLQIYPAERTFDFQAGVSQPDQAFNVNIGLVGSDLNTTVKVLYEVVDKVEDILDSKQNILYNEKIYILKIVRTLPMMGKFSNRYWGGFDLRVKTLI